MNIHASRQFYCRVFWFAFLFLYLGTSSTFAQQDKERHFHGQLRANGRFVATQHDFPPQHKGIDRVTYFHSTDDPEERARRDRMREITEQSEAVRALLGRRFAYIGIVSLASKENPNDDRYKVTFFSHELNQTIEAIVTPEALVSVERIAPDAYQPPLTKGEVAEAVDIARLHWQNADGGRVANMRGFAILAYRPTENAFFESRMAYVTFHQSLEGRPEYVAYVDLTVQSVTDSWEE